MERSQLNRCIMIFLEFENMSVIDDIRRKYDPNADKVAPHITLVFPFESDISTQQIGQHLLESLKGVKPFHVALEGVRKNESDTGLYLFMNVKQGNREIKQLHQRLNQGILHQFHPKWLDCVAFMPHMTIGKFADREEWNRAYQVLQGLKERFESVAKKVSVEIIGKNNDSIIEMEIDLQ